MHELTLAELASMEREYAESAIRSRVQTVYLGGDRVLCRVLGRQKLFLSTKDIGFSCHVMLDGYWEIWLTQFFAKYVKPGMTVVDVGANLGYYTILFGEAVGSHGRVLAVEPVPATAELLERSVRLNGHTDRTTVARVALGRFPKGEVHLRLIAEEPKNASVVDVAGPDTIIVPTTNLDTIGRDFDRIDLIKIDAEGAEMDIVAGMRHIVAQYRPAVLLEFNAKRSSDAAGFLAELARTFSRMRVLDFDGNLRSTSETELLESRVGEDWLLFLEIDA